MKLKDIPGDIIVEWILPFFYPEEIFPVQYKFKNYNLRFNIYDIYYETELEVEYIDAGHDSWCDCWDCKYSRNEWTSVYGDERDIEFN